MDILVRCITQLFGNSEQPKHLCLILFPVCSNCSVIPNSSRIAKKLLSCCMICNNCKSIETQGFYVALSIASKNEPVGNSDRFSRRVIAVGESQGGSMMKVCYFTATGNCL